MKANGYMTMPFNARAFNQKIKPFLDVPKRVSYRVLTRVKVKGAIKESTMHCNMVNLSSTGALIESDYALNKGYSIDLSFYLPSESHISTGGEVVRVLPQPTGLFQYGVQFERLDMMMQKGLELYLDANA